MAELTHATEMRIRKQPGFISANLHVSADRKRVANYAQWRTRADYDAFINDPKTLEDLKKSADIAASFDPITYEPRQAASVDDPA